MNLCITISTGMKSRIVILAGGAGIRSNFSPRPPAEFSRNSSQPPCRRSNSAPDRRPTTSFTNREAISFRRGVRTRRRFPGESLPPRGPSYRFSRKLRARDRERNARRTSAPTRPPPTGTCGPRLSGTFRTSDGTSPARRDELAFRRGWGWMRCNLPQSPQTHQCSA